MKETDVQVALNRAQKQIDELPDSIPECVRPALMSAIACLYAQGGIIPACYLDYDRGIVEVPDHIDGPQIVPFMSMLGRKHNCDTIHHIYEDNMNKLIVIFMTPRILYKLTAPISNGNVGAWTIETVLAEADE